MRIRIRPLLDDKAAFGTVIWHGKATGWVRPSATSSNRRSLRRGGVHPDETRMRAQQHYTSGSIHVSSFPLSSIPDDGTMTRTPTVPCIAPAVWYYALQRPRV
jgi:hypothetical protein